MSALNTAADLVNGLLVLLVVVLVYEIVRAVIADAQKALADWRSYRMPPPWLDRLDLAAARRRRRRRLG